MGPSHALSGAAAWLAGSWALDQFAGYEPVAAGGGGRHGGLRRRRAPARPRHVRQGHPQPGRRHCGPHVRRVSLFVAEVVEKFSLGVYTATKLSRDPRRNNGHRTFTHTLPFCRAGRLGHHRALRRTTATGRSSASSSSWPAWRCAACSTSGRSGPAGSSSPLASAGDRLVHRRQPAQRPRLSAAGLRGRRRLFRAPPRRHDHQERRADPLADPDQAPHVADDRHPEQHRRQGRRQGRGGRAAHRLHRDLACCRSPGLFVPGLLERFNLDAWASK